MSYWLRRDTRGAMYQVAYSGMQGFLSFQTVAELYRWAFEKGWSERRIAEMREVLRGYEAVPFEWRLVELWARIVADRNRAGRPVSTADAWIAATALDLDVPLMTHNRRDFDGVVGLRLISFG